MLLQAPAVLLLQIIRHGTGREPVLYAVSVSVGLAPEMLPMIISACLVKGCSDLSRQRKCIVKRLNAMHSLGSCSLLCTDKTGTLTNDCMAVDSSVGPAAQPDPVPLVLAHLNRHFQTGRTPIDDAIGRAPSPLSGPQTPTDHPRSSSRSLEGIDTCFSFVDEEPFDFDRRYSAVHLRCEQALEAATPPVAALPSSVDDGRSDDQRPQAVKLMVQRILAGGGPLAAGDEVRSLRPSSVHRKNQNPTFSPNL